MWIGRWVAFHLSTLQIIRLTGRVDKQSVIHRSAYRYSMGDEQRTRNPILLLRLSGWLLLRADARALSGLLFQEPPRNTRATSQGTPQNRILPRQYANPKRKNKAKIARGAASRRTVNSQPADQRSVRQRPAIRWGTNTTPGNRYHRSDRPEGS